MDLDVLKNKIYLNLKKFFDVSRMRVVEKNVANANIHMHKRSMTIAANFQFNSFSPSSSSSFIFLVSTRSSLKIA